jgi:hypothetical protein
MHVHSTRLSSVTFCTLSTRTRFAGLDAVVLGRDPPASGCSLTSTSRAVLVDVFVLALLRVVTGSIDKCRTRARRSLSRDADEQSMKVARTMTSRVTVTAPHHISPYPESPAAWPITQHLIQYPGKLPFVVAGTYDVDHKPSNTVTLATCAR